jgi:hypothetical protein
MQKTLRFATSTVCPGHLPQSSFVPRVPERVSRDPSDRLLAESLMKPIQRSVFRSDTLSVTGSSLPKEQLVAD